MERGKSNRFDNLHLGKTEFRGRAAHNFENVLHTVLHVHQQACRAHLDRQKTLDSGWQARS
jgi:hypothetical protein